MLLLLLLMLLLLLLLLLRLEQIQKPLRNRNSVRNDSHIRTTGPSVLLLLLALYSAENLQHGAEELVQGQHDDKLTPRRGRSMLPCTSCQRRHRAPPPAH
jgi:hypothetical protein